MDMLYLGGGLKGGRLSERNTCYNKLWTFATQFRSKFNKTEMVGLQQTAQHVLLYSLLLLIAYIGLLLPDSQILLKISVNK